MTLRLRPGVVWTVVPDGLFLRGPGVAMRLRGRSIATWFERLAPALSGRYTLADLTGGLPPAHRDQVTAILRPLIDKGVVQEVDPTGDDPVPPALRFLTDRGFPADGHRRFAALPTLVVAPEPLRSALVEAARLAGVASVTTHGGDDVGVLWHADSTGAPDEELERRCRGRDVLLGRIVVTAGRAWFATTRGPDAHRQWAAAWRRFRHTPADATLDPGTATVIAHQAVRQALHRFVATAPAPATVVSVALDDLRTVTHRVLPHPLGTDATPPTADAVAASVWRLAGQPAMTPDDFSRRAAGCVDEAFGIFTEIDEGGLAQTPLHLARCRLADPSGGPGRWVMGSGITFEEARLRTALRAFAAYAGHPEGGPPRVWGYDLSTGEPRLVPATAVAARSAAAYNWRDVLLEGLMEAVRCRRPTGGTPDRSVPLDDDGPLTERGRRCLRILRSAGEPIGYAVRADPSGAAVATVRVGDRWRHEGWGLSPGAALGRAVEAALLAYQSWAHRQDWRVPPSGLSAPLAGPEDDPAAGLDEIVRCLRRSGRHPVVVPSAWDSAVAQVNPFVAAVALDE